VHMPPSAGTLAASTGGAAPQPLATDVARAASWL
jgi:hypothetical protein